MDACDKLCVLRNWFLLYYNGRMPESKSLSLTLLTMSRGTLAGKRIEMVKDNAIEFEKRQRLAVSTVLAVQGNNPN